MSTKTMVLGAVMTALVIVLQLLGTFTAFFGPFSTAVALIPIVIGAAMCGVGVGAWLGLVFGLVVLISGGANLFLALDVLGTLVTVLVKGTACGLVAALVYRALEKFNRYVAVTVSAIVCPVVNTGIFLLGSLIFFIDTVSAGAAGEGLSVGGYLIVFFVGLNFVFELLSNMIFSPAIVSLLNIKKKKS